MSLQIVEKSGEGLSRVYGVTIPAQDLSEKLEAKIKEIGPQLKLKGFRPGKVPPAHVKRMFGRDLMREIVQEALNESSQQALNDAKVRPAASPEMKLISDPEAVVKGEQDLAYDIEVEVMPDFEPVDVAGLSLARPVYEPSDGDIDEAMAEILGQNQTYEAKAGKAATAEDGDMVLADFVGRIDGEAFEGGTAEDAEIVIGSGRFIPGFEEQLVGAKAGETRTVSVTFPEEYAVERLKGKAAEFEVTVKEVRGPKAAEADDAFAQRLGLTDLPGLRDAIRRQLAEQYGQASRFKLKRALLDELDKSHDFPLPPRMVEAEFEVIWNQVKADLDAGRLGEEDEGKSEDQLRAEYRKIAERRVRLGLVLAEIGRANNVTVSDAELNQAMMAEARRYPGQERQVFDFYRQNPNASAQLRAPVYEEKVVDLVLGKAKVEDRPVSKDSLLAEDDLPEGYGDEAKPAKKTAKAAKAANATSEEAKPAKKTAKAAGGESSDDAKPAKKPRAKKAAE
jgi:trigger factor